jgi:PKD repeat protein
MEGGIYLRHDYCGTIGTGSTSTRRTISHECAHWLNIQHVWGNSNNAGDAGNCSSDDQVSDTPNTLGNNGCNTATQTCGTLDNVQNNMDYTGSCRRMFTQGQVARMHTALNSNIADRDNLWTTANLMATGTNGPGELCIAEFSSDLRVVCEGQTIQFFDESYHGVTARTWTFTGGTPSTSSAQNPIVTFSTGGIYDVSLQVSDGTNSLTTTLQNYIVVQDDPGITLPYSEGFESLTSIPDNISWSIENENGGAAWALVNTGASGSSKSVGLNNFGNTDGTSDELMSGTIDLSGVALSDPIVFDFEYAYRKRTASNDESLKFYISKDCGETWALRKNISDAALGDLTATSSFVPQNAPEWYSTSVTNINSDYYVSGFKFKFVFQNDGGNNIYIDNINLYPESMTGLVNADKEVGLTVYPNPANELIHVSFNVQEAAIYQIDLIDALGRKSGLIYNGFLDAGKVNLEQSVKHLPSGVYFVKVLSENTITTLKFVKD